MFVRSLRIAIPCAALVIAAACSSSETVAPSLDPDPVVTVTSDAASLAGRLETRNQPLVLDANAPYLMMASSREIDAAASTTEDEVFTLSSDFTAPVVGGASTYATHVSIDDGFAYVSYSAQGDTLAGGVDIIDIDRSRVVSSLEYKNSKVRFAVVSDGKLLVGTSTGDAMGSPAVVDEFDLDDNLLDHDQKIRRVAVPGFSVLGLVVSGDYLYVVSGTNGGLTQVHKDKWTVVKHIAIEDARAVTVNGSAVTVLSGQPGTLHHFTPGSLAPLASGSKASLTLGGLSTGYARASALNVANWNFASLGDGGLAVSRVRTNAGKPTEVVSSLPKPLAAPGTEAADAVTNGVSFGPCVSESRNVCEWRAVFLANGGAGVTVLLSDHEITAQTSAPKLLVVGTLGAGSLLGSANSVASTDEELVIASGRHVWIVRASDNR